MHLLLWRFYFSFLIFNFFFFAWKSKRFLSEFISRWKLLYLRANEKKNFIFKFEIQYLDGCWNWKRIPRSIVVFKKNSLIFLDQTASLIAQNKNFYRNFVPLYPFPHCVYSVRKNIYFQIFNEHESYVSRSSIESILLNFLEFPSNYYTSKYLKFK